jgi:hypothetical protein
MDISEKALHGAHQLWDEYTVYTSFDHVTRLRDIRESMQMLGIGDGE